ncbi:MAG: L-type lectin-domain containing protein [Bernardetiaceae bacterium]
MQRIVLICLLSLALPNAFLQAQFKLMGTAAYMDNPDCILLTPDSPFSEGLAYRQTKLDLTRNFEIEFDLYLGSKDEGADGITFVIQNDERQYEAYGTWGECMGYGRWSKWYLAGDYIAPSIAVEFDTYMNRRQNDPPFDHVAYLEDGTNFHETYWHNDDPNFNLEDDRMHNFRFRWNPTTQQINVFLDDRLVHEGKRDLINDIFAGATEVIWGFTASTGRKSNLQYFCLRRLTHHNIATPYTKTR